MRRIITGTFLLTIITFFSSCNKEQDMKARLALDKWESFNEELVKIVDETHVQEMGPCLDRAISYLEDNRESIHDQMITFFSMRENEVDKPTQVRIETALKGDPERIINICPEYMAASIHHPEIAEKAKELSDAYASLIKEVIQETADSHN